MRNKHSNSPPRNRMPLGIILFTALLLVAFTATSSFAVLRAGNTIIRNTATVNYVDGNGDSQSASDSLDVTVNTVDSPPDVTFSPTSGTTTATDDTYDYTVTVRTTANGPGTVTVGNASDADADTDMTVSATGPAFSAWTTPEALFLGATVIDPTDTNLGSAQSIADGASITFTVPNDGGVPSNATTTGGSTGDGVINGLTADDTVYLYNGAGTFYGVFDVASGGVTDPAVGSGTSAATGSITLQNNTGAAIAFTPADGWLIVEAAINTLTVTQGTIDDPTDPEWESTFDVTMGSESTTATVTTDASEAAIALNKYVRNDTTDNGSGTSFDYPSGTTYYDGGVNGKPGETLEYLIHIENTGNLGGTNVILSDDVPDYTTYVIDSVEVDIDGDGTFDIVVGTDELATADGGIITVSGGTITVYLPDGDDTNSATGGGTLPAGDIVAVKYRVTID